MTKRKTSKHEIQLILTALGTGDVHGKRGKKIYTFITPVIEVPPVIIKSTVGSERPERLIMLSAAFQQPEITVSFSQFCVAQRPDSNPSPPSTAPLFAGSET